MIIEQPENSCVDSSAESLGARADESGAKSSAQTLLRTTENRKVPVTGASEYSDSSVTRREGPALDLRKVHPANQCNHCQRVFRPENATHLYCWECWNFHLGSQHIENAVRLFRGQA